MTTALLPRAVAFLFAALIASAAAAPTSSPPGYNISASGTSMFAVHQQYGDIHCATSLASVPAVDSTESESTPSPLRALFARPTNATAVWQQSSTIPNSTSPIPVVECMGSIGSPLPVATVPPKVLVPEVSNATVESTVPTRALLPIVVFTDDAGESTVSGRVIFGIVFALAMFIVLNLALCCVWNKRWRSLCAREVHTSPHPHVVFNVAGRPHRLRPSRPRLSSSQTMVGRASESEDGYVKYPVADEQELELEPTFPPRIIPRSPHLFVTVAGPPHRPRPSRPRPSSETMVGRASESDDNVKASVADGQEVELEPALPARSSTRSGRPRVPLMEGDAFN
ncbi:hypothetical protein DFH09DRAFT_1365925 [Mycena vulgaris]|nr:hypothetical protein DFH09DRAFT_1365925 [Mycena vulgaris]